MRRVYTVMNWFVAALWAIAILAFLVFIFVAMFIATTVLIEVFQS